MIDQGDGGMAMLIQHEAAVLLISDDAELGGVVAMNLRQRGYAVEHTNVSLAATPRWSPSVQHLDLVIINVETADRVPPADLKRLVDRTWAASVPIILTTENPARYSEVLAGRINVVLTRPDDVGAILGATRSILQPSPSPVNKPLKPPKGGAE